MRDVFDTYDTKNQGFIKTSLIGNILRTLGYNPLESDIERTTKEVDPLSINKCSHSIEYLMYLID